MTKCLNCSEDIPARAKFCPECGTIVANSATTLDPAQSVLTQVQNALALFEGGIGQEIQPSILDRLGMCSTQLSILIQESKKNPHTLLKGYYLGFDRPLGRLLVQRYWGVNFLPLTSMTSKTFSSPGTTVPPCVIDLFKSFLAQAYQHSQPCKVLSQPSYVFDPSKFTQASSCLTSVIVANCVSPSPFDIGTEEFSSNHPSATIPWVMIPPSTLYSTYQDIYIPWFSIFTEDGEVDYLPAIISPEVQELLSKHPLFITPQNTAFSKIFTRFVIFTLLMSGVDPAVTPGFILQKIEFLLNEERQGKLAQYSNSLCDELTKQLMDCLVSLYSNLTISAPAWPMSIQNNCGQCVQVIDQVCRTIPVAPTSKLLEDGYQGIEQPHILSSILKEHHRTWDMIDTYVPKFLTALNPIGSVSLTNEQKYCILYLLCKMKDLLNKHFLSPMIAQWQQDISVTQDLLQHIRQCSDKLNNFLELPIYVDPSVFSPTQTDLTEQRGALSDQPSDVLPSAPQKVRFKAFKSFKAKLFKSSKQAALAGSSPSFPPAFSSSSSSASSTGAPIELQTRLFSSVSDVEEIFEKMSSILEQVNAEAAQRHEILLSEDRARFDLSASLDQNGRQRLAEIRTFLCTIDARILAIRTVRSEMCSLFRISDYPNILATGANGVMPISPCVKRLAFNQYVALCDALLQKGLINIGDLANKLTNVQFLRLNTSDSRRVLEDLQNPPLSSAAIVANFRYRSNVQDIFQEAHQLRLKCDQFTKLPPHMLHPAQFTDYFGMYAQIKDRLERVLMPELRPLWDLRNYILFYLLRIIPEPISWMPAIPPHMQNIQECVCAKTYAPRSWFPKAKQIHWKDAYLNFKSYNPANLLRAGGTLGLSQLEADAYNQRILDANAADLFN